MLRRSFALGLLAGLILTGCFRFDETSESADPAGSPAGKSTPVEVDGASGAATPAAPASPPVAFPGQPPQEAPIPGSEGPFVEPPLERRPAKLAYVVAGSGTKPADLAAARDRLAALPMVPIGFPVVDQAGGLVEGEKGYVLVAGKFARKAWADALLEALEGAGVSGGRVIERPYLFNRHRPADNEGPFPKAGQVFAGMAGASVPVLSAPGAEAAGTGKELADGTLVEVIAQEWVGSHLWYRVAAGEQIAGFLPANRMLVDANLFPARTGRRAVLGVTLGCQGDRCRWDYWLVDRGSKFRRLLKSAGERMPHEFSADGTWLAYTTFDPSILVTEAEGTRTIELGPGISPAFAPDGKSLYFRQPGVKESRDAVLRSPLSSWALAAPADKVETVLDFKGTVIYPKAISTIPPRVDFAEGGRELFTLFYRMAEKKGKKQVQRWGVRFTPEGKIIETAGVMISD